MVAIPIGGTAKDITETDEIALQFRDHNLLQADGCTL
jgi:hypothetical protein